MGVLHHELQTLEKSLDTLPDRDRKAVALKILDLYDKTVSQARGAEEPPEVQRIVRKAKDLTGR